MHDEVSQHRATHEESAFEIASLYLLFKRSDVSESNAPPERQAPVSDVLDEFATRMPALAEEARERLPLCVGRALLALTRLGFAGNDSATWSFWVTPSGVRALRVVAAAARGGKEAR